MTTAATPPAGEDEDTVSTLTIVKADGTTVTVKLGDAEDLTTDQPVAGSPESTGTFPGQRVPNDDELFSWQSEGAEVGSTWHPPLPEREIQDRMVRILTDREARQRVAEMDAGQLAPPSITLLPDLLAEPEPAEAWRIEGLLPLDGHALIEAQKKVGKSTLMANLVRSFADGDDFLGRYEVAPLGADERIILIDLEMSRHRVAGELRVQQIRNAGRIGAVGLRGRAAEFDITNDKRRALWARQLGEAGCRTLIVDPLAPLLGFLGIEENDNSRVQGLLGALAALKEEAGARELLVSHHMGHGAERARGASAFEGWPDAIWRMVLPRPDGGGEPDPFGDRFFSAFGRDVEVQEARLTFDPATKRLTMGGGGNRHQVGQESAVQTIVEVVKATPGMNAGALETASGLPQSEYRGARPAALARELIHLHQGAKGAQLHYAGPHCSGAACPGHPRPLV